MQKTDRTVNAPRENGPPCLVVSIHDVSTVTQERTDEILRDLAAVGLGQVSLLVISDHHHRGLISKNGIFQDWIKRQCGAGHEAVVHGFWHLREAKPADGPVKRLVTGSYTAGEGEFFDLTFDEATARLRQAKEVFMECGLGDVPGFVAPAWLLGQDAERAVRAMGFRYTTRIATVLDLVSGHVWNSRSLVWSVRAGWRRQCSLVWNRLVFRMESRNPLLRIGIHPPDWDHRAIREQILSIVGAALAGRRAMTYDGWVSANGQP